MSEPDERLPAELAELPAPMRAELAEFLRASCRQYVMPTEVEHTLSQSVLLKESLSANSRQ